jgi:hypothetical protein
MPFSKSNNPTTMVLETTTILDFPTVILFTIIIAPALFYLAKYIADENVPQKHQPKPVKQQREINTSNTNTVKIVKKFDTSIKSEIEEKNVSSIAEPKVFLIPFSNDSS